MSSDTPAPFRITVQRDGEAAVMTILGELDLAAADTAYAAFAEAIAASPAALLVDARIDARVRRLGKDDGGRSGRRGLRGGQRRRHLAGWFGPVRHRTRVG